MGREFPVPPHAEDSADGSGDRMKICMISYSSDDDSRPLRYARSLVEYGYTVRSICLGRSGDSGDSTDHGIHFHRIQVRRYDEKTPLTYLKNLSGFFLRSFWHCTRLHLRIRFDVIHFHNIPDFGVFCTLAAKALGAKVILDIHDLVPEFYMRKFGLPDQHPMIRFLKAIERLACTYADHVLTVTDLWRHRLAARSVRSDKVTVILNTPDPEYFFPIRRPARTRRFFLLSYHGNLSEQAGIEDLIRAMPILNRAIPNLCLRVYGQREKWPPLKALAARLGVSSYILFAGSRFIGSLRDVMHRVDVGIDPKRDGVYSGETLSVKALEYMAMGLPLVVSRTVMAGSFFDKRTVRFFTPGDSEDLAKAIIDLYRNPGLRSTQVRRGLRFMKQIAWPRYRTVYFELLHRLIHV
jgi:glycosyltransferase involved in cell wall biosynthesis